MFGDDPDTSVATVRVGFGTTFGRAKGVDAPCKEGLMDKVKCVVGLQRKRKATRQPFPEAENVRRLTDYIVAIVIRWAIKRTPNGMKLGRRPTYNTTRPHANSHPIPRTFPGHL